MNSKGNVAQQIKALHKEGMNRSQISQRLGADRRYVSQVVSSMERLGEAAEITEMNKAIEWMYECINDAQESLEMPQRLRDKRLEQDFMRQRDACALAVRAMQLYKQLYGVDDVLREGWYRFDELLPANGEEIIVWAMGRTYHCRYLSGVGGRCLKGISTDAPPLSWAQWWTPVPIR